MNLLETFKMANNIDKPAMVFSPADSEFLLTTPAVVHIRVLFPLRVCQRQQLFCQFQHSHFRSQNSLLIQHFQEKRNYGSHICERR